MDRHKTSYAYRHSDSMTETERFDRTIDLLMHQCYQGLIHHRVWYRTVTEVQDNDKPEVVLPETETFLNTSAWANLYHSITFANRVFDDTDDAASIYYLLDYVNSNASRISRATADELNSAVSRARQKIDGESGKIDNLHTWRHNHFAHLDKENLKEENVLDKNPVQYRHIKELLSITAEILNDFKATTDRDESPVWEVVSHIDDESSDIFGFIRSHQRYA